MSRGTRGQLYNLLCIHKVSFVDNFPREKNILE